MKKPKKGGKTKVVGVGLEGFVDWTDPTASNLDEEREDDMSSLAVGFVVRMCKQAASSDGETTPALKCQAARVLNGLVRMEKLRTVRLLS